MTTPESRGRIALPSGEVGSVWIRPRGAVATLVVAPREGVGHPADSLRGDRLANAYETSDSAHRSATPLASRA